MDFEALSERDYRQWVFECATFTLKAERWWYPASYDRELASRVIKQVTAEPKTHVQDHWITLNDDEIFFPAMQEAIPAGSVCGSAACLAGWTAIIGLGSNLEQIVTDLVRERELAPTAVNPANFALDAFTFTSKVAPMTAKVAYRLLLGNPGWYDRHPAVTHLRTIFATMLADDAVGRFAAVFQVDPNTGDMLELR